jgi:hypothetical protein
MVGGMSIEIYGILRTIEIRKEAHLYYRWVLCAEIIAIYTWAAKIILQTHKIETTQKLRKVQRKENVKKKNLFKFIPMKNILT